LGFFYWRRAAAKLLTKDEARRMALGGEGLSAKLTGGTASLGWIAACTVRRMTP
jgi:hypothetical protein